MVAHSEMFGHCLSCRNDYSESEFELAHVWINGWLIELAVGIE
jgi:hypothetical protein